MASIPSASIDALLAEHTGHDIPGRPRSDMKCCCGREDCAYLRYNTVALDGLEKDVKTAAGLGQALLVRHEQYMHDAERERAQMTERISTLEDEKKNLELENSRTIEENRGLLEQLEQLNTTALESEAHVKSLEATLQSTQQELKRLDILAARAGRLEMQVAELELEQNSLQTRITKTKEEERSAIRRWQQAERELSHLEDQLETIEREAREEKDRHAEIVSRMHRQRAVEKELDTAARRLKGAAAVTTVEGKNSNVVSHFVKDILQDNANLQLGIMELRELLNNSNDEVQHLREMLMEHQPVAEDENGSTTPNLQTELTPKENTINQELHIHHHYHPIARPVVKKKRAIISGVYTPPPGTPKNRGRGYGRIEDPRTPRNAHSRRGSDFMHPGPPSAAAAILSQTSITIPSTTNRGDHRWSLQTMSDFAASSAPSSPNGSMYRNSALFDMNSRAGFNGDEESRPTSPGSSADGVMSPTFNPFHRKRASDMSCRSFTVPPGFMANHAIQEEGDDDWNADVDELKGLTPDQTIGKEEHDQTSDIPSASLDSDNLDNTTTEDENETNEELTDLDESQKDAEDNVFAQPRLCRTTSHESIISISGLDIHTLRSRPQQIEMGQSSYRRRRNDSSNNSFTPTPSLLSSSFKPTGPITGASDATAVGIAADGYGLGFGPANLSARRVTSSIYLRENFIAAGQRAGTSSRGSNGSDAEGRGLSRKVGGWIAPFSRWAPTLSHNSNASSSREGLRASLNVADNLRAASSSSQASINSFHSSNSGGSVSGQAAATAAIMGRPPGINQKGAVPGWAARRREPVTYQVRAENVDLEGLSRALEE